MRETLDEAGRCGVEHVIEWNRETPRVARRS